MADWHDVMRERAEADDARCRAINLADATGADDAGEVAYAILIATVAVCAELRALGTLIDHVIPYSGGSRS